MDKVIKIQEDRSLFSRMMVVCTRRPDIDLKEAIGQYEFSVVRGLCLRKLAR